ncbi:MAG: lamin tail domain-containing protein, partial [Actinomycetes bacterium]
MNCWALIRSMIVASVLVIGVGLLTPIGTASAASTDVVISEFMYNPVSEVDGDEFLELANTGATPVDLSGWCFSGITLCFASGTEIAGGGYLVVSPDAARTQATYGVTPAAVYTGKLANGGEKLTLKDASAATIDTVTYADVAPWPVTPDGLGKTLELIDPTLNNDDPLNWAASTAAAGHTAGRANSVAASGLGPRISAVAATPTVPTPGQAVTVTATITDVSSARVIYRTDFGAEQTTAMTSVGADAYTATLPGAAAGHLIRYRIEADNAIRTSKFPRVDDTIIYQGVVAASGVTSALPIFDWFIADADYNYITSNPTVDIERHAVLAYNGMVIDNVLVNIRGAASQTSAKPNWKFELPKSHVLSMPGYLVEPVDEFAMQADFSDKSHGRPLLAWDAYQLAGVANTQVFPVRTQRNGAFQGLYTYVDLFDGTWRAREGYDTDQFFKAETGAFSSRAIDIRFEKKNPPDTNFAPLQSFLNGVALTGNARRDYLLANAEIPELINYAAVTAIIDHVDSSSKNFYLTQDPVTSRWTILPWDLDHTFGNGCCQVSSTFVTPAEAGDKTNDLMVALLAVPEWRQMYFRRLKTLVGEILAPGRPEAVYDAKVGPAQATTVLDFATWNSGSTLSYAGQRSSLFNALNARRTVFANDSRLPAVQSAAPNVVVNEIQHSPVAGDNAEFVELYNPSATEAVDLSDWSLTGGITLNVPPGTVILPQGTMTFAADDPTFRATYGSTVFLGGVFDGALAESGTLTLARPDGSTADTVTYGDALWPTATGGPSLELLNPNADNNDPTNWALSLADGGTPGAANQGGGTPGDVTPPNTAVTAPASGATLTSAAATVTGTASDDVDVARVDLTLQNTTTGAWLQTNGTFGATAAVVPAILVNDAGTSTGWQLGVTLPDGGYALTATAVDVAGNLDGSPATRSFSVAVSQGPDTVDPNGTLTAPTSGQILAAGRVSFSGAATDNRDVARVAVSVRNRGTGQYLQANGSFGAFTLLNAAFTTDNGTSVTWSLLTSALPPGLYRV